MQWFLPPSSALPSRGVSHSWTQILSFLRGFIQSFQAIWNSLEQHQCRSWILQILVLGPTNPCALTSSYPLAGHTRAICAFNPGNGGAIKSPPPPFPSYLLLLEYLPVPDQREVWPSRRVDSCFCGMMSLHTSLQAVHTLKQPFWREGDDF